MFGTTPPIVKNLLIINVLMLLATYVLEQMGLNLSLLLGLHHWSSDLFNPFQMVSYMFMHGGLMHLFFNMFALWMFGRVLEQVWGSKRFLIYYMVTGIGAGLIQLIVMSFDLNALEETVRTFQNNPAPQEFYELITSNPGFMQSRPGLAVEIRDFYNDQWTHDVNNGVLISRAIEYSNYVLNFARNVGTVGASGSVFGILLAFGMLFPNTQLMLLFPPIPIKAKYFVIGYGVLELYMGLSNNPEDNVAHFAHLGGMLFGFILIKYWKKSSNHFY